MKRFLTLIALAAFCFGALSPLAQADEAKTPAHKRAIQKKAAKKKASQKAHKSKKSASYKHPSAPKPHP